MTSNISTAQEKHPKQDFQVERLAFFSDAVFAIAITLLIIEFKVPVVTKDSTYDQILKQLLELKFQFIALLGSFWLIAIYWIRHHLLFKHIHNYNSEIVITSMLVLLPIVFFPFTTAFLAESLQNKPVSIIAIRLFILNNILAGLFMSVLYWLAFIRHKSFSYEMARSEKVRFISKTVFTTFLFIIFLVMTFMKVPANYITIVVIIVAIIRKVYVRHALKGSD